MELFPWKWKCIPKSTWVVYKERRLVKECLEMWCVECYLQGVENILKLLSGLQRQIVSGKSWENKNKNELKMLRATKD